VLDDDEAVFGVLQGGDEEAADQTEDEDVALHDGVVKKYNGERRGSGFTGQKTEGPRRDALPGVPHSRVKRVWEQIRCETKMMWLNFSNATRTTTFLRFYDFNVFTEKKRIEKLRYIAPQSGRTRMSKQSGTMALEQLPGLCLPREGTGYSKRNLPARLGQKGKIIPHALDARVGHPVVWATRPPKLKSP